VDAEERDVGAITLLGTMDVEGESLACVVQAAAAAEEIVLIIKMTGWRLRMDDEI